MVLKNKNSFKDLFFYITIMNKLNREWVLWFDEPMMHNYAADSMDEIKWVHNIDKVCAFNTLQGFWGLYNNIHKINDISYMGGYYIFEENTKPITCDLNNLNGGILYFYIPFGKNVNEIWLNSILLLIGNSLNNGKFITGLSIEKNKRYYTFGVFFRTVDEKIINPVLEKLVNLINDENAEYEFITNF